MWWCHCGSQPEVGDSSHMTWFESVSSCKFEDLKLTWLTLMKCSTWLWLGIHNFRLDTDDSKVLAFLSFSFFCAYWDVSFVFGTLPSVTVWSLADGGRTRVADSIRGGEAARTELWKPSHLEDYFMPGWFWPPSWLKSVCVCFRYTVFTAHKDIILNAGAHNPTWHHGGWDLKVKTSDLLMNCTDVTYSHIWR